MIHLLFCVLAKHGYTYCMCVTLHSTMDIHGYHKSMSYSLPSIPFSSLIIISPVKILF